jgi:hypothetical protein
VVVATPETIAHSLRHEARTRFRSDVNGARHQPGGVVNFGGVAVWDDAGGSFVEVVGVLLLLCQAAAAAGGWAEGLLSRSKA